MYSETLWSVTLARKRRLQISLAKADGMRWWPAVVKGQPEINLQKVRSLSADVRCHLQTRSAAYPPLAPRLEVSRMANWPRCNMTRKCILIPSSL